MSEITAYEKMLKDGSAFKKIDMNRIQSQMYAAAEGGAGGKDMSQPLGEPITESHDGLEEDHTDWTAVDEGMQRRMNALREKIDRKKGTASQPLNESQEIAKLKKRVKRLEEALMVIMETQEKLL